MQHNRLLKRGQKLISSSFLHGVCTLITGTIVAQFIPVLLSPVLTRIYLPKEFGIFAFYISAATVLAIAATACYEQAIILPEEDNDALNILVLCCVIALTFSFSLSSLLAIYSAEIASRTSLSNIQFYITVLPLSVLLLAVNQSLYYWFNRVKLYKAITINKVVLSVSMVVAQLGLYKMPEVGLVAGYLIGQILGIFCSASQIYVNLRQKYTQIAITRSCMAKQAKRYIKFPKFLLPGHMMNSLSGNMPIVLLSSLYGVSFSGFYSLTSRIIALPMSLIGSAISDVFRQAASRQYILNGECRDLFVRTFKSLLLLAIIPFTLFFLTSLHLFPLLFGSEWVKAGRYAWLLTPMLFCQFITIPLCSMFIIAEKQELDLAWQIARMVLSVGSLYSGYLIWRSDESSIFMFSISFCILYLASAVMGYSFSSKDSKAKGF
jgi:O-antigen/teichoic acid export membrane protein